MIGRHFRSKTKNVYVAIHVHLHSPAVKQLFQRWTPFLPSLISALLSSYQTSLPTSHQTSLLTSHQTSHHSPQPSQSIFHFLCLLFYCVSLLMKSKKIKKNNIPSLWKMIKDSDLEYQMSSLIWVIGHLFSKSQTSKMPKVKYMQLNISLNEARAKADLLGPSAPPENLRNAAPGQGKKSCGIRLIIILFLFHKVC